MKILVGHTGFVGSNIASKTNFDGLYNSANINEAFGLSPDLLIYSGVRAEKFLANKDPEADLAIINNAIENIKKINPKKIVLISTVDVYPSPNLVDEDSAIDDSMLQPYGKNRLLLEQWVENNIKDHLIIRLPGLFGENIKKNFIYDLITFIPAMLKEEVYHNLKSNEVIKNFYEDNGNGFFKVMQLDKNDRDALKQAFKNVGFSALNFTDSRGVFQFYNLQNLWDDITKLITSGIKKVNLASEPVSVGEIYRTVYQEEFKNELSSPVPYYNFYTKHAAVLGGNGHYISDKHSVLADIKTFIKSAE